MNLSDLTPEEIEEHFRNGHELSSSAQTPPPPILPPVDTQTSANSPEEPEYNRITGDEALPAPQKTEGYAFKDPVELLVFLDDNVREGRVKLHPWQVQFMLDFAEGGVDDRNPFQALVRAANGSGKDKYVVAVCSVWITMCFLRAKAVITSASGNQLDRQTCTHISFLCEQANKKIHPKCWKINYRHYTCLDTASPIDCFATDEPGKAEGWHPFDAGCKLALFMSEAKTIPDEINVAYNKCTGYTHRVHVSTPGLPLGHFHDACMLAVKRKDLKSIKEAGDINYIEYHITAYECPHLSTRYIEQMKRDLPGGENGAAFKSQVLAQFGTTDEMVVIPYHYVWNATKQTRWEKENHNKGGLDLSDGGAETVLVNRNGNRVFGVTPFKFDNTQDSIDYLDQLFREKELNNKESLIFGDCVGMGKPMIDNLVRKGWANMRYIDARHRAYEHTVYANYITELWFNFRKLLERGEIILPYDELLIKQLATRFYKILPSGKHALLSKIESRAKGYPSPDRADACVMAFADYKSSFTEQLGPERKPFELPKERSPVPLLTEREWARRDEENRNLTLFPSRGLDFSVYKEAIAQLNEDIKASKQPTVNN